LKASYNINGYSGASKIVLQALKTYGMIVADNGSSWFISGANDNRWDNDNLDQLKAVPGSAFEVVYTGGLTTYLDTPPASASTAAPRRNYFTTPTPTFTWNRVTGAVRYDIEVANNASFIGAATYNAGNNLTFTWPLPWADGSYFWHVRGCTGTASTTCGNWGSYDTFVVDAP
jgi:hypothetical protein